MALKDDIALLKRLAIFEGLEDEHMRLLAFGAEHRILEKGHVLFRENAAADAAFVIVRGHLALTQTKAAGGERNAGVAGPGTILTEIAMITPTERRFNAVAEEESEVIRISRTLFRRMLEEYPEVAIAVEGRVRANFTRLVEAAARAAPQSP
jgi:CRP-like cAMP-binding protein